MARFIWPLQLPLSIKIVVAALALVALQFHRWSKLSSGSVFSPEFPRPVVVLFNWAFGAIVLLALMQLLLDVGLLFGILIHGGIVSAPDGVRYGIASLAAVVAAIGVHQAMRIPPLKDIEVGIQGLPRQFDGYTILQLTDLHISRLFPASWARDVVERSNELGADLIAITGDLIDGTLDARRTDVEPLQDLKATDGVYVISGNHEYIFGYSAWMAHFAALGLLSLENRHIVLDCNGGKLVLAGITDRASRRSGHPVRDLSASKAAERGSGRRGGDHGGAGGRAEASGWLQRAVQGARRSDLGGVGIPTKAAHKSERPKSKKPASRPVDAAAERKAALAYEREQRLRERERAKEEDVRQKDRESRQQAVDKAQAALDKAEGKHGKRAAAIQVEAEALEKRSQADDVRWDKEKERLKAALRRARD